MSEARLEKLKEKEAQLKAQIKQEQAKAAAQARKANNHRLIQIGSMVDVAFGRPIEEDEMKDLVNRFKKQTEAPVWVPSRAASDFFATFVSFFALSFSYICANPEKLSELTAQPGAHAVWGNVNLALIAIAFCIAILMLRCVLESLKRINYKDILVYLGELLITGVIFCLTSQVTRDVDIPVIKELIDGMGRPFVITMLAYWLSWFVIRLLKLSELLDTFFPNGIRRKSLKDEKDAGPNNQPGEKERL